MSDLEFISIDISNFKTFSGDHTFKLERPPGVYYITGINKVASALGANGVGKSTIWDALTWVLWGRTGRDNRPADAVKPWVGKGQTVVTLQFNVRGERHVIQRTRNPNKLVHSIVDGGLWVSEREITDKDVPALLGMTEEMFRRTLVLGQFGTLFLDLKPEAQAQMFTEALGLDLWLRLIDIASAQGKAAQRAADQAVSDQQANDAALATVADEIVEYSQQAETFAVDQAAKVKRVQRGIATLETDLAEAQAATPKKPALPDDAGKLEAWDALQAANKRLRDDTDEHEENGTALERDIALLEELNKPTPKCGECGQALPAKQATTKRTNLTTAIVQRRTALAASARMVQESTRLQKAAQRVYDGALAEYDEAKGSYNTRLNDYEKAVRKVASIQGELGRWRADLEAAQAEKNTAAAAVTRLKARRAELRAEGTSIKAAHEQALADVEKYKFWQDGYREIRLGIIDHTLVELEMATCRHVAMLGLTDWGVKFDTERETKGGTISYNFSVLLYPPGKDKPVKWESYSGGESQRLQLATSFALSEVLLSRAGLAPNIEVLDEPTKGLNPRGVDDLLEHLSDRARELGRAIYFVDHHSLDKGAFDGTLLVTKTSKGSTFAWQ